MTDHLSLLCELDPEHFRQSGGHMWWRRTSKEKFLLLIDGITWEIAGWMLDTMRARHEDLRQALIERKETWQETRERDYLYNTLTCVCVISATKERITNWYLAWKEFLQRLDAPAATLGTVTDQSPQQPKETCQAPANTHDTDH